ncbi:MAG: ACT domain-containing protein [Actinomycetota bacterium]|nr:ACT domain-containing protein [Actinomycetota bacterium]
MRSASVHLAPDLRGLVADRIGRAWPGGSKLQELTLTAVGRDRPGIVAGVTKVLFEQGCNLEDCSMTLLRGQFAMIMLLQAPDELSKSDLERALSDPAQRFDLSIVLREAAPGASPTPVGAFVVSLYGADRPGIVYRISEELARRSINITDLMSRVVGDNVYIVVMDIDLAEGTDVDELRSGLERIGAEIGVEVTLRPAEIDEL